MREPWKISKKDGVLYKSVAMNRLYEHGIDDKFTLRVKTFKRKDNTRWVALYRGFSQFASGPIIWINEDIPRIMKEKCCKDDEDWEFMCATGDVNRGTIDSIIHEYAHVIAEYARYRDDKLRDFIKSHWHDEEEFAEHFINYINDDILYITDEESANYKKVVDWYMKHLRGC
jgi:hypothetical protein